MLRNEVQKRTGLTRKAIEYYENKGLIKPEKNINGYRIYSEKNVDDLLKISIYRNLDLSVSEIQEILNSDNNVFDSIIRKKEQQLEYENKKIELLKGLNKDCDFNKIKKELDKIAKQESVYSRLEKIFPGYFGQLIFSSYKPFLQESLSEDDILYFEKFVDYLDSLPNLELTLEEQTSIQKITENLDILTMDNIQQEKIYALENYDEWYEENEDAIEFYQDYINSEEYLNSPIKSAKDKLNNFMNENNYYEIAIPLIRKFSKSYNEYYKNLLEFNDKYFN